MVNNSGEGISVSMKQRHRLLLFSVFIIATCGLVYELIAGTLASYLLGDSVTQFSTIIGTYLFSMGIGSWLSRYIEGNLLRWFIKTEILVGIVGGCSAPLLFLLFEYIASFRVILYAFVCLTGILVGLEIPILMRILKSSISFKDLVSQVFTFDYIGALLASIIFPLLLVPHLGLIRTSLFFGILNIGVAAFLLYQFDETRPYRGPYIFTVLLSIAMLLLGFVYAERIMSYTETLAFQDQVIFSKSTPYQRIVFTRNNREMRLFLNGNLQFSSADEYRYHEALVHPAMQALPSAQHILILGGGDGMAAREILKYSNVKDITLVDLDPAMTEMFKKNEILTRLNNKSLLSKKMHVINDDAFQWVRSSRQQYDCIIIDFPDPSNFAIGKLYTSRFYEELQHLLADSGIVVVQSTSPLIARKSYWCINHTLNAAGFITAPYHVYVPSFGEWGYVMGMKSYNWRNTGRLPKGLKFLNDKAMLSMFIFPPDMAEVSTDINKLNNQALVTYFEQEWAPYAH